MDKVALALIGATGIIGQEILSLLAEEQFETGPLQLSASDDSAGEMYDFRGSEHQVVLPEKLNINNKTLAVLCAPRDVSQGIFADLAAKSLAVLDCSGIDRSSNNLRLMPDAISASGQARAYSVLSPCGYMIKSLIDALDIRDKLSLLVATTLEPVSGAGRGGLDELWNQTRSIFNQSPADPEFFPEQIAFNIIPQVDVMRDDGVTAHEKRMIEEIFPEKLPAIPVSLTAIRSPVMYGTGISLTAEVESQIDLESICRKIDKSPRFTLDQNVELPPSTLSAVGDDKLHVGRIRVSPVSGKNSTLLSCWMVADNIRACVARPVVDLYRSLMPAV